jgi:heterotetrameric sarcosine oxidase gamma subunit
VAENPVADSPVAHSPIAPVPPLTILDGWQVSAREAETDLTLTDCSPMAKIQVRADPDGATAAALAVRHGQAVRDGRDSEDGGTLVAGSGPGEWMFLAAPGEQPRLLAKATALAQAGNAADELVTAVDLTHGRALVRLIGDRAARLMARVCAIDLSDAGTKNGTALRTAVAGVATDIIRDDEDGTPSYLLHCERSSGQYLFDALLGAGEELQVSVRGFAAGGGGVNSGETPAHFTTGSAPA